MMTWRERLAKIREGKQDDIAIHLAGSWSTCAVGEQRQAHPDLIRFIDDTLAEWNRPEDNVLFYLGVRLPELLSEGRVRDAENVLDQVEDRVLELKRTRNERED